MIHFIKNPLHKTVFKLCTRIIPGNGHSFCETRAASSTTPLASAPWWIHCLCSNWYWNPWPVHLVWSTWCSNWYKQLILSWNYTLYPAQDSDNNKPISYTSVFNSDLRSWRLDQHVRTQGSYFSNNVPWHTGLSWEVCRWAVGVWSTTVEICYLVMWLPPQSWHRKRDR